MDRFDLEQAILNCWCVTDDLETLAEKVQDNDEMCNIVLGMKYVYQMKFEKCFDTFETLVKEQQI